MNRWLKLFSDWNRFWFREDVDVHSSTIRIGLGIASMFAFIGHILFAEAWLGSDGWLNPASGLYLVGQGVEGTGAEYRWSIFYTYPNLLVPLSWVGAVVSGLLAASIAPRVCALVAFVLLAMLHHRAPLFMGRGDSLVLPFLLYSLLLPSTGLLPFAKRGSVLKPPSTPWKRELATLGLRLMQVHFFLWFLFSLTTMLGNEGWWTGEAVRQLLADAQGWLPTSWATVTVAEWITHGVIQIQIAFLFCMLFPSLRVIAFGLFVLFLTAALLVIGDWQYVIILAGVSLPLWVGSRCLSSNPQDV